MKLDRKGFTLVELIVVIGLMIVLLAIAAPMVLLYLERGRAAACLGVRYHTERAETAYIIEKNAPSASFSDLVGSGFLTNEPACPSGGNYVWIQRQPAPILGCPRHYATIATGDTADVLYSSTFDGQSGLQKLLGNWNAANGTLNNKSDQENRIAFGDTAWKDYEIRTSAFLTRGPGYGIYYRADGNPDITGYIFQYDPGWGNKFLVRKVVDGVERSPFQFVDMPAGFPIYNQSHDISIAVVGDRHIIKVDNQTIMDFHDDSFASGSGGFRTWGQTAANFDNLSVLKR